jgi:hypothetical protein
LPKLSGNAKQKAVDKKDREQQTAQDAVEGSTGASSSTSVTQQAGGAKRGKGSPSKKPRRRSD